MFMMPRIYSESLSSTVGRDGLALLSLYLRCLFS